MTLNLLRTMAAAPSAPASAATRTVYVELPAGTTQVDPGLDNIAAVSLVSRPDLGYELVPDPVQRLLHVTEDDARRSLDDRPAGMPLCWSQTDGGAVLLGPSFTLPVLIEIEGT